MARSAGYLIIESSTAGTRTWSIDLGSSHADDVTPGSVFNTLDVLMTADGVSPPEPPNTLTLTAVDGLGNTLRTINLSPTSTSTQRFTWAFTTNANTTGQAAAGTIEWVLRANRTDAVGTYNLSTDGRGTQNLGSTNASVSRDRPWQRANTSQTLRLERASDNTRPDPLTYNETVRWRVSYGHPVVRSGGTIFPGATRDGGGSTSYLGFANLSFPSTTSTTVTTDGNSAGAIAGFPAARHTYTPTVTYQNQTVSTLPPFVPTSTTIETLDIDPRLTVTQVKRDDNNTLPTPPSSFVDSKPTRLQSQLSFLWTRLTNARAEGVNGVVVTRHLYDVKQLVGTPTAGVRNGQSGGSGSLTTGNLNGEAGWTTVAMSWSEVQPGGGWAVRHTASSNAAGMLTPTDPSLTLIASDPQLICVTAGGPGTGITDTRHFTPGEEFIAGLAVFHVTETRLRELDNHLDAGGFPILDPNGNPIPKAKVAIARFNLETGQAECLQLDRTTWLPAQNEDAVVYHQLYRSSANSRVAVLTVPGTVTANWTTSDIFTVGYAEVGSTPVAGYLKEVTVLGINNHTSYTFDPTGLFK